VEDRVLLKCMFCPGGPVWQPA